NTRPRACSVEILRPSLDRTTLTGFRHDRDGWANLADSPDNAKFAGRLVDHFLREYRARILWSHEVGNVARSPWPAPRSRTTSPHPGRTTTRACPIPACPYSPRFDLCGLSVDLEAGSK